jgi:hypothetical protein
MFRCGCTARNVFRCRVWNEVDNGEVWSEFYRAPGKKFESQLISDVVDLAKFLPDPALVCESCTQSKVAEIYKLMNKVDVKGGEPRTSNNHFMTTG